MEKDIIYVAENPSGCPPEYYNSDIAAVEYTASDNRITAARFRPVCVPRRFPENRYSIKDGQWVAVDTTRSGQNLLLTMEGTQGTFFLQPKGNGLWKPVLLMIGGTAGLDVLLLIASKRKRGESFFQVLAMIIRDT